MSEVVPFPLTRRVGYVNRQARTMASMSVDGAERYMAGQIKQQRDVLARKGIAPERIESELLDLDRAVRARMWHEIFSRPGGRS